MPAKNIHHDAVIRALEADGWTITDDPLWLQYDETDMFVDLAAERLPIGAEKGTQKIAVEIQSFLSPSPVRDLQQAVGQYSVYRIVLKEQQPERLLFLAVTQDVNERVLADEFGQLIVSEMSLKVLVFDDTSERIVKWIE